MGCIDFRESWEPDLGKLGSARGTMDNFFPEVSELAAGRAGAGSLPAGDLASRDGKRCAPRAARTPATARAKPERAKLSGSRQKSSPGVGSLTAE